MVFWIVLHIADKGIVTGSFCNIGRNLHEFWNNITRNMVAFVVALDVYFYPMMI